VGEEVRDQLYDYLTHHKIRLFGISYHNEGKWSPLKSRLLNDPLAVNVLGWTPVRKELSQSPTDACCFITSFLCSTGPVEQVQRVHPDVSNDGIWLDMPVWSGAAAAVAANPWLREYIGQGLVRVPDAPLHEGMPPVETRSWYNLPIINEKKAQVPLQGVVKNIVYIGSIGRRGKERQVERNTNKNKSKGQNTTDGSSWYTDKGSGGHQEFVWKKKKPYYPWKPYS
jgi:hypothetical protein